MKRTKKAFSPIALAGPVPVQQSAGKKASCEGCQGIFKYLWQ